MNTNIGDRLVTTHFPVLRGDVSVGSDFRLNNGSSEVSGNTSNEDRAMATQCPGLKVDVCSDSWSNDESVEVLRRSLEFSPDAFENLVVPPPVRKQKSLKITRK